MDAHETDLLAEVREAMKAAEVRLSIVPTFTHGEAVRIEVKHGASRWKKAGPLLFPPADGTTTDTLTMLGEMRAVARQSVTA